MRRTFKGVARNKASSFSSKQSMEPMNPRVHGFDSQEMHEWMHMNSMPKNKKQKSPLFLKE